jgi:hypothetical protein
MLSSKTNRKSLFTPSRKRGGEKMRRCGEMAKSLKAEQKSPFQESTLKGRQTGRQTDYLIPRPRRL